MCTYAIKYISLFYVKLTKRIILRNLLNPWKYKMLGKIMVDRLYSYVIYDSVNTLPWFMRQRNYNQIIPIYRFYVVAKLLYSKWHFDDRKHTHTHTHVFHFKTFLGSEWIFYTMLHIKCKKVSFLKQVHR